VQIEFIASFATITTDPAASRALYVDALGLPLDHAPGDDYIHSEAIGGSKHFGVWPLEQAARACFGADDWPAHLPPPQACVEFEFDGTAAVQAGIDELRAAGYKVLHDARLEPWGQTVGRLLSPEHVIIGLSYAPWLHT
jgi:catechol 2,3-dioxygenase-like lactoylglutathione lyase family enzyme